MILPITDIVLKLLISVKCALGFQHLLISMNIFEFVSNLNVTRVLVKFLQNMYPRKVLPRDGIFSRATVYYRSILLRESVHEVIRSR